LDANLSYTQFILAHCIMRFFVFAQHLAAMASAGESNSLLQATTLTDSQHPQDETHRNPQAFLSLEEDGCIDKFGDRLPHAYEDCTFKDFFIFKGTQDESKAGFRAPTFDPDEYNEDTWWQTVPAHHGKWEADCIAYVKLAGSDHENCNDWCGSNGMTCVRGADDAHHQTAGLSNWLSTMDYEKTDCTLIPHAHDRQGGDENGCEQVWATQICGCAKPTTTTTTILRRLDDDDQGQNPGQGCVKEGGAPFDNLLEDCTFKDFFEFKGSVSENKGSFIEPTYHQSVYGSDNTWATMPVQESDDWAGTCVAYVNTSGGNCDEWCSSNGMTCQKGMDDAHFQTVHLSEWLSDASYSETDCTLHPASSERQTADDNGCKQRWKTQICACAEIRLPPDQFPPAGEKGCVDNSGEVFGDVDEDCTNSDFFEFRGKVLEKHEPPTFDPTTYGADAQWQTKKVQAGGWEASCVAYVQTNGTNCKSWCESKGMSCTKAMDDAHHQTIGLSEWLGKGGYTPTDCTILPYGHYRQIGDENGCLQKWKTQICACN